jgi:hypothetical protein
VTTSPRVLLSALLVAGFGLWFWPQLVSSQVPAPPPPGGIKGDHFEFEVVESFDAKYEGDTPGHIGRHGGLGEIHPQVALGDPIFLGDKQVGVVTGLRWSRAQGALDVEFDPATKTRIAVGDVVWLKLGSETK